MVATIMAAIRRSSCGRFRKSVGFMGDQGADWLVAYLLETLGWGGRRTMCRERSGSTSPPMTLSVIDHVNESWLVGCRIWVLKVNSPSLV